MFDPISVIIFRLKDFVQHFTGIFSFIFTTYFPEDDEEAGQREMFAFL